MLVSDTHSERVMKSAQMCGMQAYFVYNLSPSWYLLVEMSEHAL